jgi:nucleotide-binding universal stress UspA family protein
MSPMGVQPALLVIAAEDGEPVVDVTAVAEARVEEAAAGLDVAEVETIVSVGDPGPEICRLAEQRDVDVVVLGAHDRGWLSRLLEPSVARHVVDHAPCHVLVVRNPSEEAAKSEGAEPR